MSRNQHQLRFVRSHHVRRAIGAAAIAAGSGLAAFLIAGVSASAWGDASGSIETGLQPTPYLVFAYNDLGMHCMQDDFSELMILPPFNNLHAQVIKRDPNIVHAASDFSVEYSVPNHTHAVDKTNFWTHAEDLVGVPVPPNIGLTGNGLSGHMTVTANQDWEATGIPVTPIEDDGTVNPYPFADIVVRNQNGQIVARTQAVIPVSTELSCYLCHGSDTETPAHSILAAHDKLHATTLLSQTPVLCASCHADVALGAPGTPGVSTFSSAMHTSHADRVGVLGLDNECYACHPGVRTKCHRDVHLANGMDCNSCHTSMEAVGDPMRRPWIDEPRCADCHSRPGFEFEQPGKLFRESRGHGGVMCMTCHNSPHALTPTVTETDNYQALVKQGHVGVINECTLCHTEQPDDPFPHRFFLDD